MAKKNKWQNAMLIVAGLLSCGVAALALLIYTEKDENLSWPVAINFYLEGQGLHDLADISISVAAALGFYSAQRFTLARYNYDHQELAARWVPVVASRNPIYVFSTGKLALMDAQAKLKGADGYRYVREDFRQAFSHGIAEAALYLGYVELIQKPFTCEAMAHAQDWFKKAAAKGDIKAQLLMAYAYGGGIYMPLNMQQSIAYFESASKSEDIFLSLPAHAALNSYSSASSPQASMAEYFRLYFPLILNMALKTTPELSTNVGLLPMQSCISSTSKEVIMNEVNHG